MVIDIDSFLDKYKLETDVNKDKDEKDIVLDFQKDVEDKLYNVEKEGSSADYELLKKIFLEVKDFDLDLTSKFLGIESKSDLVLKSLGEKYSGNFLKKVKSNVNLLTKILDSDMQKTREFLNNNLFTEALDCFHIISVNYEKFPDEFIEEKIDVSNRIKKLEIEVFEKINKFRDSDLIHKKVALKKALTILSKNLIKDNIQAIKEKISNLIYLLDSIPKIFISDISKERIYIAKVLFKAELFLKKEYEREFNSKKKIINGLVEKFHNFYLKADVENTVLTYDEILFEFKSLPEVFLEEKIKIYNEINKLYGLVGKLLLKSHVSLFLESYKGSKILEESKEYLRHCKLQKKINLENLNILKSKLTYIPERYHFERDNLEKEIDYYITEIKKRILIKENKSDEKKKIKKNSFNISNKENLKKVLNEINIYYEKIKNSNDANEIKIAYKKIIFYLDLVPFTKTEKSKIQSKVKALFINKKLK